MGIGPRVVALVIAATVWCGIATAQGTAPPPEPPTSAKGVNFHDGFYLRAAIGGGRFRDDFKHEVLQLFGTGLEGHAEGASVGGELSVGYAVRPGLIIGGAVFVEQVASPEVEIAERDYSDTVGVGTLVMAGPIIEWYIQPEGGFHLGGGPVGARLEIKDDSGDIIDHEPIGGGAVAGLGYEGWVGEQWALGVMGRFAVVRLQDYDIVHVVTAASLLANVTFN